MSYQLLDRPKMLAVLLSVFPEYFRNDNLIRAVVEQTQNKDCILRQGVWDREDVKALARCFSCDSDAWNPSARSTFLDSLPEWFKQEERRLVDELNGE